MTRPEPPHVRVLRRTLRVGECLEFAGYKMRTGYGVVGAGTRADATRRTVLAHSAVWEAENGPVPAGMEIDHICRNRACVRLDHLQVVTHEANCARAVHDARLAAIASRTHCKRGHEYNTENTRISKAGTRQCRPCLAEHARNARAKARQNA